jgi:hypothetical protein
VRVDWHDYLINCREPGKDVALNFTVRPPRARATGLQYKGTVAGLTSAVPYDRIVWPTAAAGIVRDGSVTWTAEAISSSSLRATVSANTWTFDTGVTKSDESNSDFVYTAFAASGSNGEDYELRHEITLSGTPAEKKEALIILPVRD